MLITVSVHPFAKSTLQTILCSISFINWHCLRFSTLLNRLRQGKLASVICCYRRDSIIVHDHCGLEIADFSGSGAAQTCSPDPLPPRSVLSLPFLDHYLDSFSLRLRSAPGLAAPHEKHSQCEQETENVEVLHVKTAKENTIR